jgi:predicted P-loop ATPase
LGAEDNEYTRAASRNFWISLVARVYRPGCLMRTMVVLKSKQWTGKSTAFATIGGKWYAEIVENINSNNFFQVLHGHLILEFADLSGFDRADITRIKQIVSCWKDVYRTPYDRDPAPHLRQSIFVATTNEATFLRDDTGNTRFWPVETTDIKLDLIATDRLQLFAEAVGAFKAGETWHIMPQEATEEQQEKYRKEDAWEQVITDWLVGQEEITIMDIASRCLHMELRQIGLSEQHRIGRILAGLGWHKSNSRRNGRQIKVWLSNSHPTLQARGEWEE